MAHTNQEVLRIENTGLSRDAFHLRYNITMLCNYSCDFCVQGSREAHAKAARGESATQRARVNAGIVRLIETSLRRYSKINLELIGGEVTILPDLPDLLRALVACSHPGEISVHITTNLSLPAKRLIEICKIFRHAKTGRRSLSITASFYEAYTTEEEFLGKLQAVSKACGKARERGIVARVRQRLMRSAPAARQFGRPGDPVQLFVGYPILSDDAYEAYLRAKNDGDWYLNGVDPIVIREYPVELSDLVREELLSDGGSSKCALVTYADGSQARYRNIQRLALDLSDVDRFCPRGYVCDAGVGAMTVKADGTVFRCPGVEHDGGASMGNIFDEGFALPTAPFACEARHCSCNYFHCIERAE